MRPVHGNSGLLKFSIITPSLNMGRFIEQCIQGVMWQDYEPFEHLIIDGGSKDNTVSILEKYDHLKWISEPDRGLSDALNKGVRMATGDLIGWCCADDYYLPGAFKLANRHFQESPSTVVLYGDYRYIGEDGHPFQIRREIPFDLTVLKYLHVNYIATPAAFWRREIHRQGFWFDEKFRYAMDYDFLLRIALARHKFRHIPVLMADFRRHPATKSASWQQPLEQSQIVYNSSILLGKLPFPLRVGMRNLLLLYVRSKRSFIRALQGHYFEQLFRS